MKILLITNKVERARFEANWVNAIACLEGMDVWVLKPGGRFPDMREYDAVILFVKFKQLRRLSINWGRFDGLRVLMDHDAFLDYGGWSGSPYLGEWRVQISRLGIDLLVVSGEESRKHFAAFGIDCAIVHKGYDEGHFYDLGGAREDVCYYGSLYRSRAAMLRRVRGSGIQVADVHPPYDELNLVLNRFVGVLVCNMQATVRYGKVGRAIERGRPGSVLTLRSAPEPMGKNFEAAAAGCAVFMDWAEDLSDLGFIDGETALIYRDFDELIEKLDFWLGRPDSLLEIGQAAATLCAARHTWSERAGELERVLESRL